MHVAAGHGLLPVRLRGRWETLAICCTDAHSCACSCRVKSHAPRGAGQSTAGGQMCCKHRCVTRCIAIHLRSPLSTPATPFRPMCCIVDAPDIRFSPRTCRAMHTGCEAAVALPTAQKACEEFARRITLTLCRMACLHRQKPLYKSWPATWMLCGCCGVRSS